MAKLLYVDDEIINLELFKINFSDEYDIHTCYSAIDALELLKKESIDLVITDFKMPQMNGVQFIDELRKLHPNMICLMLTGYMDSEEVSMAIEEGKIKTCIIKPWKRSDVDKHIKDALGR